MNPYEVLGVAPTASAEEVRRAYLGLARRFHPDYFTGASSQDRARAEARMREVNEAWSVLGDAERRRRHDDAQPQGFRPLRPDEPDEPDPRDAPDVPYRPAPPATLGRRTATMAPVLLFGGSVAVGVLGLALSLPGLLALSLVLFVGSCVGFLVLPLLALSRARQDEG